MEIQTETEPLNIRREKYTLKLVEKCTSLPADRRKCNIVASNTKNFHLQWRWTENGMWFNMERMRAF